MVKPRTLTLEDSDNLKQLVRNLKEGIYITTDEGEILDANPAFLDMFGVSSMDELKSTRVDDLMVSPELHKKEMEILHRDGAVKEFELEIKRVDGQTRTVLDTCFSSVDQETGKTLYHGILVDITERKHLENKLLDQSIRDPLTGCYNRRYLSEFEARAREMRKNWGCIIIDIDNFKHYNDHFGHKAGDTVLIKMSRFLMRHTRAEEGVVRMGGDEFLVLLSGADPVAAQNVAKRIIAVGETQAPVPFSLGWASSQPGETLEKTIDRADQNLLSVRVLERPRGN